MPAHSENMTHNLHLALGQTTGHNISIGSKFPELSSGAKTTPTLKLTALFGHTHSIIVIYQHWPDIVLYSTQQAPLVHQLIALIVYSWCHAWVVTSLWSLWESCSAHTIRCMTSVWSSNHTSGANNRPVIRPPGAGVIRLPGAGAALQHTWHCVSSFMIAAQVVNVSIDTIDYVPGIGNGAESENNPCYRADSAMLLFVHCCYWR
jgi:hypothetical protein